MQQNKFLEGVNLMAFGKRNFSGKRKSFGGKKKKVNTKKSMPKKEVNGFSKHFLQGEIVQTHYQNNGTPFWRGKMEIVSPDNPNYALTVFVKAFDDIARELKDVEEGDIINIEASYRVEKFNDGYFHSFIIKDIFEPEDPEQEE